MIQVLLFARLREQLDTERLELDFAPELGSVAAVIQQLQQRGAEWDEVFAADQLVMVAVNQAMADLETVVKDGDEVAFFPPVTGG